MRAHVRLILTACLVALLPAKVSAFSAQDVLTVCLATHADPGFVRDKLRSLGWTGVDPNVENDVANTLTLATLASWFSFQRRSFSPDNWKQSWEVAQRIIHLYLDHLDENSAVVLREPGTKSLILVSWRGGSARDMQCLLAVTEAATKPQSYHPRLQDPDGGDAFYSILESSELATSRINGSSVSVSVDRDVVKSALGIDVDVVAVFQTRASYPASAVTP